MTSTTVPPAPTTSPTRPTTPTGGSTTASPITPADPGTYRYDTTGQSRFGTAVAPLPAVTTLVVDPPAGTTQRSVRDLRDTSGNGPVLETVLDYRADGVYLVTLRVTATFLLFTETRELRPPAPVLLLTTGAGPGLHRELDLPTPAGSARVTVDVEGQEQVTIGGRSVATTVVRLGAVMPGPLAARLGFTVWVAPGRGLWVKEHWVGEAVAPDGQVVYRSDYDATLQRLTPA